DLHRICESQVANGIYPKEEKTRWRLGPTRLKMITSTIGSNPLFPRLCGYVSAGSTEHVPRPDLGWNTMS
ncbi:hypothetical protein JMJ77_0004050, partial [Colletotrichum scovillei]